MWGDREGSLKVRWTLAAEPEAGLREAVGGSAGWEWGLEAKTSITHPARLLVASLASVPMCSCLARG